LNGQDQDFMPKIFEGALRSFHVMQVLLRVHKETKQDWRPSRLERHVAEMVRHDAEREAVRIPWRRLYVARKEYVEWDAFTLWVRAIEHTEGILPDWVVKTVARRCPGFFKFAARKKVDHSKGAPSLWDHLHRWIHERAFAAPWREGWMHAVGYYAVRDLACRRNEDYWEYCEREWARSKPAIYPSFREWLKASEQCSDEVLDEYELRDEKRRLIKLMRLVTARRLPHTVKRYVEWVVFAFWTRTALEDEFPLPTTVERELKRRCPGFLEAETVARATSPGEETFCRFDRLLEWIDNHEFAKAKKEGWYDVIRYQARLHPRHSRVTYYWHDWEAERIKYRTARYPAFKEWPGAADRYTVSVKRGA
jgi:hypothetical protein